jgi:formamidopyrimidine-DNA glycosylase
MPELPDIVVYQEHLAKRLTGSTLEAIKLPSPFVLRTAVPPIGQSAGRRLKTIRRIGKRLVLELEGSWFLVLHLMVAGRLRWADKPTAAGSVSKAKLKPPAAPRNLIAEFEFDCGRLFFTEAGTRKRASIHLIDGEAALAAIDPGGLEVLQASLAEFSQRLTAENHTLKRALTDPHAFSGIGNAYSDEILHRAQLSPIAMTKKLPAEAIARIFDATRTVLTEWTDRLRREAGDGFPEGVTAFRTEMAVHGKFGQPCPTCAKPVQRIVYSDNETNYCAHCQTGGVILKDRALSRLLKASWPRSIDDI